MKHPARSAFTLIEVLISASITAMIMAGIYSAFRAGILSYHRIDAVFGPYQTARNIFNRMASDIGNSFAFTADDPRFNGSAKEMKFFSVLDAYEEGNEFRDLYRIEYASSGNTLIRTAYPGSSALAGPQDLSGQRYDYRIDDITFEYAYRPAGGGIEWQDAWPANDEQKKHLPLAVKIKLALNSEGRKIEFNKLVALSQSAE